MGQLTPHALEALLTEYGWTYTALGPDAWATGFQGEDRLYPLHIRLTRTCVSFEVRPLVDASTTAARADVLRELLELNDRMQLVKVGVTEGGEVSLAVQVLAAGFDLEMLTRILGILGYYADEVAPEIARRLGVRPGEGRPELLS